MEKIQIKVINTSSKEDNKENSLQTISISQAIRVLKKIINKGKKIKVLNKTEMNSEEYSYDSQSKAINNNQVDTLVECCPENYLCLNTILNKEEEEGKLQETKLHFQYADMEMQYSDLFPLDYICQDSENKMSIDNLQYYSIPTMDGKNVLSSRRNRDIDTNEKKFKQETVKYRIVEFMKNDSNHVVKDIACNIIASILVKMLPYNTLDTVF